MKQTGFVGKKILDWALGVSSSPVKAFIFLAAIFGLLIILFAPPLTGADEEAHFVRAYGISTGHFRLYDTREVGVPKTFRKTIGCFQTKKSEPGIMYKYDYSNYGIAKASSYACALKLPLRSDDTELASTTAQFYSPTTYIPQTAAILIGRWLGTPIIAMVYMVRVFVLVAYIFMLALAIKLLPIRKWALVGIALLPTPMLCLTNPGGDYMLFGSMSIVMAIVIRGLHVPKAKLQKEDNLLTILLAIAAIMMVLPKGLFPGICLLPLVVFYGGLSHKKIRKTLILVGSLGAGLFWQKFGVNVDLVTMHSGIISPLSFPHAFLKTMFTRWVDTDFIYTGDSVGNIPIPGNHLGMPALVVTLINILFAVYIFVAYPEKPSVRLPKRRHTVLAYTSVACALAITIGSFAALYVGGSYLQATGDAIRGVQTRYLFPAFFMLAVTPFARIVFVKNEKSISLIVLTGTVTCLLATLAVTMAQYHWLSL